MSDTKWLSSAEAAKAMGYKSVNVMTRFVKFLEDKYPDAPPVLRFRGRIEMKSFERLMTIHAECKAAKRRRSKSAAVG